MNAKFTSGGSLANQSFAIIRKGLVIGLVAGILLAAVLVVGASSYSQNTNQGHGTSAIDDRQALAIFVSLPVILFCKVFNCESFLGMPSERNWLITECFAFLVFKLFLALAEDS